MPSCSTLEYTEHNCLSLARYQIELIQSEWLSNNAIFLQMIFQDLQKASIFNYAVSKKSMWFEAIAHLFFIWKKIVSKSVKIKNWINIIIWFARHHMSDDM